MSARYVVVPVRCAVSALAVAIVMMGAPIQAQEKYEVRGLVTDSAGMPLNNAMVVALTRPDSVLAKFGLTGGDGRFAVSGLTTNRYILQVTLLGYETYRRDFEIAAGDVDAGTVRMVVAPVELDSLVVSVEHVPFISRGDTLSYNVLAFPTAPNAMVEDLLRRLPGIEVENDGSIKAQGEQVENVLVDGKEFFGKDPKIATRNLPADAVKQVDVYDKQSDMAEFTGIPDGEDERTIDLKLREEAKRGHFGRATGGFGGDLNSEGRPGTAAGNDLRYDGRVTLNRFSPTVQMSFNASTNNVNQAGFSTEGIEFVMASGGGGAMVEEMMRSGAFSSGGGGFGDSRGMGLNLSRDFGEKGWIRSSYFLSDADSRQDQTLQQQALRGADVALFVDETRDQESGNTGHRVNVNGQYSISPGHQLRIRVSGSGGSSDSESLVRRETRTVSGQPLNTALTDYRMDGGNWRGDAQLTWRKRMGEEGRSLVAEFRSGFQDSDRLARLESTATGEFRASGDEEDLLQEQSNTGRTWNNSGRLSFTQPLGERYVVEVFGRGNAVNQDQNRDVHDLAGSERVRNSELSSGFKRTYNYYYGGARLSRTAENKWITVGLRAQRSDLNGRIAGADGTIANGYTHLLGNVDLKWQVKEGQHLGLSYRTSTREPSLNELQPFVDNRDPVNIYVGNPRLQPEYSHRLSTDYRYFDQFSFVNLFARASFSYTDNPIARSRVFDDQGFQTVTPINTDASWSVNGHVNFGTPIRKLGIDVDLEYGIRYSETTEVVNLGPNENRTVRNTVEASLENRNKERFDVDVGASFTFNDVEYSLNQALNRDYVNRRYFANGTLYLGDWTLRSTFNWRVYDQNLYTRDTRATGESNAPGRNVARWDARVSRRLLDDRAEIELRAYDLLNQNQSVNISNTASYIQESRTESLRQYLMLRVSYRLGMRGGFGLRR
ncbi:MAG: outer membrane beta-barrel family protein [Gemmatimonadota bacterium]|nr:outer membrane beta-barrel family protein [Gemmatimonadota bacterium]MDE2871657.1 outer membrane beta-barrel family protein [Gemmatimonadota bacterium]